MSTNAGLLTGAEYGVVGCEDDSTVPVDGQGTPADCDTSFGGTSAATPFTAGVVALMLDANPALTPEDVKEILHQTAELFPDHEATEPELNAKWNYRRGYGYIDAYAAVMMAATWPGMELGADTDSDGVRDYLDVQPFNALVAERVTPTVQPAGGQADSDGDGLVDADDPAPLDPEVAAPASEEPQNEDAPMPILVLVAALLVALRSRR